MTAPIEEVAAHPSLVRRPRRSRRNGGSAPWFAVVRAFEVLVFVAAPILYTGILLHTAWTRDALALDLTHWELPAAEKIYHGESPYPGYGYPPLVAFALVPLVPVPGADILATVLLVLSVPAILWLLGVRDWRCYGLAFLWEPVFSAIQNANVTLPMMLLLALAWRFRHAPLVAGSAVGVATASKILAWPAGLWLLATRRVRGWVCACGTAVVLTFGLWAILGFDGLFGYPSNLQAYGTINAESSYTITQLLADFGAPRIAGQVAAVGVALVLLVLCAWAGLRGRDRVSFALAATACVYASPITWMHSFSFLLLAVAVMRPRLSIAWLVPLAFHLAPGEGNGEPWQTALALGVGLVTCLVAIVSGSAEQRHPRPAAVT